MALHETLGATMLYVTHDQVEALTMGQRVVVMQGGQIQQVGTPSEVYVTPVNVFVARFVGSPGMNLLSGGAIDQDGGRIFQAGGLSLPIGARVSETIAQVGVRPEHVTLVTSGGGQGNGEVQAVERLGSETLVHVRLTSNVTIVARLPGLIPVQRGDTVGVTTQLDALHWFDKSGRRC
jgi:ABC-type sugar transport system ATPase subunit